MNHKKSSAVRYTRNGELALWQTLRAFEREFSHLEPLVKLGELKENYPSWRGLSQLGAYVDGVRSAYRRNSFIDSYFCHMDFLKHPAVFTLATEWHHQFLLRGFQPFNADTTQGLIVHMLSDAGSKIADDSVTARMSPLGRELAKISSAPAQTSSMMRLAPIRTYRRDPDTYAVLAFAVEHSLLFEWDEKPFITHVVAAGESDSAYIDSKHWYKPDGIIRPGVEEKLRTLFAKK